MIQKTSAIMKRAPILFLVCLLLLTACSKEVEIFKGTVHTVDEENKRILVISQLKEEDLSKDYKEILDSGVYSHAIWVDEVATSKYKKGDEAEISYEASDDSFPAQVTPKKITKVKD
ncbi:hypothetical protein D3C76_255090 [compost metagenome]